eukprot:3002341-Amphidinium_carterae.2
MHNGVSPLGCASSRCASSAVPMPCCGLHQPACLFGASFDGCWSRLQRGLSRFVGALSLCCPNSWPGRGRAVSPTWGVNVAGEYDCACTAANVSPQGCAPSRLSSRRASRGCALNVVSAHSSKRWVATDQRVCPDQVACICFFACASA